MTQEQQEQQDKQAFFALYLHNEFIKNLKLRSTSQITDEELKLVKELENDETIVASYLHCNQNQDSLYKRTIHYLREIGIAVPFRKYSVEEMIEKGWIKIKE